MESHKEKAEEKKGGEAKVIEALLREKEIAVSSPESVEELASRGYGTAKNKELILAFYEALYLVSKNIVALKDMQANACMQKIDFQHLLSLYQTSDENAWAKYLIYRDLRSRGYVVREGFGLGMDFRVYERGEYGTSAAKNLILGIQEGQPLPMEDLIRTLKYAHSLKKNLILAVLNRRGEVVYYSLSKLTLK